MAGWRIATSRYETESREANSVDVGEEGWPEGRGRRTTGLSNRESRTDVGLRGGAAAAVMCVKEVRGRCDARSQFSRSVATQRTAQGAHRREERLLRIAVRNAEERPSVATSSRKKTSDVVG